MKWKYVLSSGALHERAQPTDGGAESKEGCGGAGSGRHTWIKISKVGEVDLWMKFQRVKIPGSGLVGGEGTFRSRVQWSSSEPGDLESQFHTKESVFRKCYAMNIALMLVNSFILTNRTTDKTIVQAHK